MGDHFDISGVFETTEFEIAKSACTIERLDGMAWCGRIPCTPRVPRYPTIIPCHPSVAFYHR